MNKIKWIDLKFETEYNTWYKENEVDLEYYKKRKDKFAKIMLHEIKNKVRCFMKFDNGEWCSIIGCPPIKTKGFGLEWRCYGDGVDTFEIQTSKIYLTDWNIREYLSKSEVLEELNDLKNTKVTKKQKARLQKIKNHKKELFGGLEKE